MTKTTYHRPTHPYGMDGFQRPTAISLPAAPFDIPAATDRSETAPRSLPIRVINTKFRGKDSSHYLAKSEKAERSARENLTLHKHLMGYDVDVNVLPLDKLFR
jgi:hypothetical protein